MADKADKPQSKWSGALRVVLLVLGLAFVVYLVIDTGPAKVWSVLRDAGRYIPVLLFFEAIILATDSAALASILGERSRLITARGWIRSSAISFACLALLPAGRTASEVARAAIISRYTGPYRSATAGAELQAVALVGDGLISGSLAVGIFLMMGNAANVPLFLAGNFLLATFLGVAMLALLSNARLAAWAKRRFPRLVSNAATEAHEPPRAFGLVPALWTFLGRWLQVAQYGFAVLGVGGVLSAKGAFMAHGIHMVAATVGMMVPNQVGVADGAYLGLADTLGFGDAPARALGVALVLRVTQLLFAAVCIMIAGATREPAPDALIEAKGEQA